VTAPTTTGAGRGRSARQSWGFTKWPHSHWAEPNNTVHIIFWYSSKREAINLSDLMNF
jgi:hypothetical protein